MTALYALPYRDTYRQVIVCKAYQVELAVVQFHPWLLQFWLSGELLSQSSQGSTHTHSYLENQDTDVLHDYSGQDFLE